MAPSPPEALDASQVDDEVIVETLSGREHEVLALIAQGASNSEIAGALTLSLNTVKRHTSNILGKLNAANRTQAVAYARRYGLLAPAHPVPYSSTAAQRFVFETG
jgi:LuxR family maltose regulon positive regulatory protein